MVEEDHTDSYEHDVYDEVSARHGYVQRRHNPYQLDDYEEDPFRRPQREVARRWQYQQAEERL